MKREEIFEMQLRQSVFRLVSRYMDHFTKLKTADSFFFKYGRSGLSSHAAPVSEACVTERQTL